MGFFKGMLPKAVALSVALAVPALAQQRPPVIATAGDDRGFADTGLTSFEPIDGRGYKLEASLSTLYDGNILRLGNGSVPRPGSERADFRFSPVVTGNIGLPVGQQQFFAGVQLGTDVYAQNTQLNRARYIVGGGVNLRAGRLCTATVAADFSSRQILLSQIAESIPNVQETLTYGTSINCQAPAGLGAGITLRQLNTGNSSLSRASFDVNSTIITPQITYVRPSLGSFSLSATINQVTYPNRILLTPELEVKEDGVNIFSGRFGYQRALGTRLSLTAGISYFESNPQPVTILAEDADLGILFPLERSPFSGLGYDAQIAYTPSPRLATSIAFSRNATASPNVGALAQVVTLFGVDATYRLGASITVGVGGTYTIRDYEDSFVSVDEPVPRVRDNIGRIYGQVSYNPPKFYSISLLLAYQNRNSNPDQFSFDSFSALLTIALSFGSKS